jgi:hypothetical protein
MDVRALIKNFETTNSFSASNILEVRTNKILRAELVNYFRNHRNRTFALALLNKFTELRKDTLNEISIDDLMLASFILGMHHQVEDSLKIWEAKRVDFDTYCGVDMQLVPFAGVNETIAYLQTQTDTEAQTALEYVAACARSGDFDDLEDYYSGLPWWV